MAKLPAQSSHFDVQLELFKPNMQDHFMILYLLPMGRGLLCTNLARQLASEKSLDSKFNLRNSKFELFQPNSRRVIEANWNKKPKINK